MDNRRFRSLRCLSVATLACSLSLALAPATAQISPLRISPGVLRPPTLVTPLDLNDAWQPPVVIATATTTVPPRWLRSSFDMDLPRDTGTGVYTRPKIVVGLPSPQMRNWLRASGVDAERCMLPMLRARTSTSGGDLNGSFWLYARCTFH